MNDFNATRAVAVAIGIVILCACASTITDRKPGFGNRIARDGVTVEPSPLVVEAAERMAARASDTVIARVIDAATTAGAR